jgi:peptidoglycan/xylan/chitin deacetylase (PgdA/CDA1 family)
VIFKVVEMTRDSVVRILAVCALPLLFSQGTFGQIGQTEITKWQYGKKAAASLTYDDGSINQFRVAVPIMDKYGFPATFFIITGEIPGSQYHGTFIGRPTKTIIEETASVPTNKDNFFERASAIGFLGYSGTANFHTQAGEVYDEQKNLPKAYKIIDDAYDKVRQGAFKPATAEPTTKQQDRITWDELAALAKRGYEFASHTVTHPRVAALDDANLIYELEKSRQDILDHLGFKHTFSVECPYGTEDRRGVAFALQRYQLARNFMPDAFVDDLDRGSDADPAASKKEYVRWQRGPVTKTPMELIKSWVDKSLANDNVWLVLVSHGVDGIGWEPKTHAEIDEYLAYMKSKENSLWVATFQDAGKYMRERMHADVHAYADGDAISVVLRQSLSDLSYDLPLTLKTFVPSEWARVEVRQGGRRQVAPVVHDQGHSYVLYQAIPNGEVVKLAAAKGI